MLAIFAIFLSEWVGIHVEQTSFAERADVTRFLACLLVCLFYPCTLPVIRTVFVGLSLAMTSGSVKHWFLVRASILLRLQMLLVWSSAAGGNLDLIQCFVLWIKPWNLTQLCYCTYWRSFHNLICCPVTHGLCTTWLNLCFHHFTTTGYSSQFPRQHLLFNCS